MNSKASPIGPNSKRGDLVESNAGPVGRYVGTLRGLDWIAYEGGGFASMCAAFDKASAPANDTPLQAPLVTGPGGHLSRSLAGLARRHDHHDHHHHNPGDPPMSDTACSFPILDSQKRARICGKPATTTRVHVGPVLPCCPACAAEHDAKQGGTIAVIARLDPATLGRLEAFRAMISRPDCDHAAVDALRLGLQAFEASIAAPKKKRTASRAAASPRPARSRKR